MKKGCLVLSLMLAYVACFCQVQTRYVRPDQTDPDYASNEDSSAVSRNESLQLNKLFLFIGGTASSSSNHYGALRLHSANLGFDFINLSYPNSVATAGLANDSDSLVFNTYRQELCFGTPVSADVSVDSLNSIYTRTIKLIQYLALTYPLENWEQYLATPDSLDWSKIIVGGHSQGSGHACYLAKKFLVDRVLMFAGPNDYSDFYSNAADWIRQTGVTPANHIFSYLSLNDEAVSYFKQYDVISNLGLLTNDDTTYVDNLSAPYENSHCLYTTQPPGLALLHHNVPIKLSKINKSVWTYMLTSTISTGQQDRYASQSISLYPNPASDFLFLRYESLPDRLSYSIYTLSGQFIKNGIADEQEGVLRIDISDLNKALYLLEVNGRAMKFVKE